MCHDPHYVEQLQADLDHFTELAENGDVSAANSAELIALELQALNVRPAKPTRPLFNRNKVVDGRLKEVTPQRARMGFVRT